MRRLLFKFHSYLALIALIPLVIVSITGSILVFKTEIDQWWMPKKAALPYYYTPSGNFSRQNHNNLQSRIEEAFPNHIIGAWEMFTDGKEADRVYIIKKGTDDWFKVYFDPYANKVLSQPESLTSYITDWLLDLHYTFMLNGIAGEHSQWGTALGLIAAIILVFLGVSGLIIHRKFWLQLMNLRLSKSLRIFYGDLHRLIGAWSSPVIFILGLTGIYFNAMVLYHEIFEHPSEDHYKPTASLYSKNIDFQSLLNDSQVQIKEFTPTYLLYPYEPKAHITIFGYKQNRRNPFASNYASTVTYNRSSSDLISIIDGGSSNTLTKITDSFRELHFGSFAGLTSKIIWCMLGLSPIFLGLTGLYIWSHRKNKKKR